MLHRARYYCYVVVGCVSIDYSSRNNRHGHRGYTHGGGGGGLGYEPLLKCQRRKMF